MQRATNTPRTKAILACFFTCNIIFFIVSNNYYVIVFNYFVGAVVNGHKEDRSLDRTKVCIRDIIDDWTIDD